LPCFGSENKANGLITNMLLISCRKLLTPKKISDVLNFWEIDNNGITKWGQKENDTANIIVHGYKTSYEKCSKTFVKLNEMWGDIGADNYGFTWPSKNRLTGYIADFITVNKESQKMLMDAVRKLRQIGYEKINVVAHSIGCYLVINALANHSMAGEINTIVFQGADVCRGWFKANRKYGKAHNKIDNLYNYYSHYDRILRTVAKIIRPYLRIGRFPMPKKAPENYYSLDAAKIAGYKVRHTDYRKSQTIQDHIRMKIN